MNTVTANELAIKALRCPEDRARVVYQLDGHGNDGLKLYVEHSGTKTWYYRACLQAYPYLHQANRNVGRQDVGLHRLVGRRTE